MTNLQVVTMSGGYTELDDQVLADFSTAFRGPVLTSDSPDYDEVRVVWNRMIDKRPALIVRCTGTADVVTAVNFARENNLLTSVRGGEHNVSGSSTNDGGMMIDLQLMNAAVVDQQARSVRVQGGATLGDLDHETQAFGLATPGGVVSTTGVAGLTLGGGLSHLRRKYGLALDNLLSVEIVTAGGQVLTASAGENSDLFWGVRGGGGNFGVVTSFEFQLHAVGPLVTLCAPWYPVDNAKELLLAWSAIMQEAPQEFSCNAMFWTVPPIPDFPEEHHGKRFLAFAGVHCGSLEEGERITNPLRELGTPMVDLSGPAPLAFVNSAFDPFFPKGERFAYFKSQYLNELDETVVDALLPRAINPPDPSVLIVLWHYGGAMRHKSGTETAFMGREAPYLFSVDGIWDDASKSEEVVAYAREFLAEMKPYSPGGLYVNFAGFGEEGNALVRSAYGENYDRLVSLKDKYDPANLFRLNQNVKPTV